MEKFLNTSRFLVLITVVVCLVAAVILYILSIILMGQLAVSIFEALPIDTSAGKLIAVTLLKVLDILLIAVTFQIIGIGFYRLFIAETEKLPNAAEAEDFNLLKAAVLRLGIVILIILFLEQAVDKGPSLDTLYFGIAIALMIFAATWAADRMSVRR